MLCMDILELSPIAKLEQQIVCLGIQTSYCELGYDCSHLYKHSVGAELQNIRGNIYLPVQQTASSNTKTGHKLQRMCTSQEETGHHTVEACNWLWVQKHWSSFRSSHNNCVPVYAGILHCYRYVVGTGTDLFPRTGQVWRNGCIHWEQVEASAVYWCYWWITRAHVDATGVPLQLLQP